MAGVSIKFVVSFSSQDDNHKVSNIVNGSGFRYWLSHPKEKSGQIEAIFQLEKECLISNIDVGSMWCANMELQVGKSDWVQGVQYKTLLPTVCLTSPSECKNGEGTLKNRIFSSEHFCTDVSKEKWDRIKVICRQPFRKDVQYGLTYIRIRSENAKPPESNSLLHSPSNDNSKSLEDKCIVKSIQKHFFGRTFLTTKETVDPIQLRLLKIAATSENGVEQGALPRTAKLVLAASEHIGKYSPQSRTKKNSSVKGQLFSEHLVQKYGPKFDDEVTAFLGTLQLEDLDLDQITIADLRHRFEKTQKRKLNGDEKQIFMELCQNHICDIFDKSNNKTSRLPSNSESEIENESLFNTPSRKRKANDDADLSSPRTKKVGLMSAIKKPQTETTFQKSDPLNCTPSKMMNGFSSKSPVCSEYTSSTIKKKTSSVEQCIRKTDMTPNKTPTKSKLKKPLDFMSPTNHNHLKNGMNTLDKNKDANSNYVNQTSRTRSSMETSPANKKDADHCHIVSLVAAIKRNFPKSSPLPTKKAQTAIQNAATTKPCTTNSFPFRGLQLEIGPINSRTKTPPINQLVSDIHGCVSESSNEWLSKEKGLVGFKSAPASSTTPRGQGRSNARGGKRGRGGSSARSRKGSNGKTRGASNGRKQKDDDWSGDDVDLSFPEGAINNSVLHNYVFCSSCKGNVPEYLYSQHYLTCCASDSSTNSPSRRHLSGFQSLSSSGASLSSTPHSSQNSVADKYWNISSSSESESEPLLVVEQNENSVSCPICGELFPEDVITTHANFCCETIGFH